MISAESTMHALSPASRGLRRTFIFVLSSILAGGGIPASAQTAEEAARSVLGGPDRKAVPVLDYFLTVKDMSRTDKAGMSVNTAITAIQQKRFRTALAELDKAEAYDDSIPEIYFYRGFISMLQGRLEDGLINFKKALELRPDYAEAQCGMGTVLSQARSVEAALPYFRKSVELNPDLVLGQMFLGDSLRRVGKYEDAVTHLTRAIEIEPEFGEAYASRGACYCMMSEFVEAQADLLRAVELGVTMTKVYLSRGVAKQAKGDLDGAISDFTEVIKDRPFSDVGYLLRSRIFAGRGDVTGALRDLNQAMRLVPKSAQVLFERALLYEKMRLYGHARRDYDRAIQINPAYPEAFYNRGRIALRNRQFEEAKLDFERALQHSPDLVEAIVGLARISIERGLATEAFGNLARWPNDREFTAEYYTVKGRIHVMVNEYEAAVKLFSEALAKNSSLAEAYEFRGQALEALGRIDEAKADRERALLAQ